jgi:hypothetical protein
VLPDPHWAGLPQLPHESGATACREGDPDRAGQPVHAHHARRSGLAGEEPERHFPLHAGRLNQIETWFGIITRQAIRRGTFTSVRALIAQITDYINSWNANPRPFTWIATADEILAKVKVVEANVRKLVDNNA